MSGSSFDRDLATVLRRPMPALVALVLGALVGFTGMSAAGGDDGDVSVEAATVEAPREPRQTGQDRVSKTSKSSRRQGKKRRTEKSSRGMPGALAAVQPVVERLGAGSLRVGVAMSRLGDPGQPETLGSEQPFTGWSTLKIPAIAAVYANGLITGPDADVTKAITQSDNEAVRRLYKRLIKAKGGGPAAANAELERVAIEAGAQIAGIPDELDPSIDNSVAFGTARWSPADGVRVFRALGCGEISIDPEDARFMLTQMSNIQGQGRWGAVTNSRGATSFAKGGWSDSGDVVSQFAIIGRGRNALVIGVMTEGNSSFEAGQQVINQVVKAAISGYGVPADGGTLPARCA